MNKTNKTIYSIILILMLVSIFLFYQFSDELDENSQEKLMDQYKLNMCGTLNENNFKSAYKQKIHKIIAFQSDNRDLVNVNVNPYKVRPGDNMNITAEIECPNSRVELVEAIMPYEGGVDLIKFNFSNSSQNKEIWKSKWRVHDTITALYKSSINVVCTNGEEYSDYFYWYDPVYYRVNSGETKKIDEHGICKEVTNGGSKDIFIPTKTQAEWESFINNAPSEISLSECGISVRIECSATSDWGFCRIIDSTTNCIVSHINGDGTDYVDLVSGRKYYAAGSQGDFGSLELQVGSRRAFSYSSCGGVENCRKETFTVDSSGNVNMGYLVCCTSRCWYGGRDRCDDCLPCTYSGCEGG